MELSDDQKKRFEKWFVAKAHSFCCPVCAGTSWLISSRVAITNLLDPVSLRTDYMSGFSTIPVTCKNCAYVAFFSAEISGIIEALLPSISD